MADVSTDTHALKTNAPATNASSVVFASEIGPDFSPGIRARTTRALAPGHALCENTSNLRNRVETRHVCRCSVNMRILDQPLFDGIVDDIQNLTTEIVVIRHAMRMITLLPNFSREFFADGE
jgi:hypothetical protein